MRSADTLNNSIDAQSAYSERLVSPKPMEGGGGSARSQPRGGSKRVSRRDQMPSDQQHKRYSSTEAVHNELRSNSIPPLSIDEQAFASASSIPGTPYEERHMPDLADQAAQKPTKVKKSRRTRSASLTNQSQDDSDNPPRRKKVPRVPKVTVASAAANNNLENPEKLKPPLPPTAPKKLTENQTEVVEVKPRKKKAKKRTTSKSSTASANDTLDKSLEDWDKSPNVTIDQQETATPEPLKVSDETAEDVSTPQIEQPSKAVKKRKKRTTSKSSTASAENTLDRSLEDWNKPDQSEDVAVDQAKETQRLSGETTEPVILTLTSGTDDYKEELTHVTDDNKADILADDNNNDLWDLFDMKLNALCHYLLNGKHDTSIDRTKMKNQTNKQMEINPEFIENEAVVVVENNAEKSSAIINGPCNELKSNGKILASDDSNEKLLSGVTHDLSVEIKPPTGKKKKKQPKVPHKESAAKIENRHSEYRLAMNGTHESTVDDVASMPETIGDKTEDENEMTETLFNVRLKNKSPDIPVPQNNIDINENNEPVINHEVKTDTGEKEGNTPTLNFEYNVDSSDQESPNSIQDERIDLLNFDNGGLKVTSWERKEFEDAMTTKNTTPFSKTPYRISLKPARSEESLAMRTRSETDAGFGRRSDLLTATGRLRVARSVDRLNADDRETSVPLIKRRSLSKEWQVVTLTTTEEIIVVKKGKNDAEHVDPEPSRDLVQKEKNETKHVDVEHSKDLVQMEKNETKHVDVEPSRDFVQRGKNDTKHVAVEPSRDFVKKEKNDTEHVNLAPIRDIDVEDGDVEDSSTNPNEIKYIDSEDSIDMEDFTWPSPPPLADNKMPSLTREYAVKQINADVRLVVPLSTSTTASNDGQERNPIKPSPPRIESTIRSRIEMLSLYGYDKKLKPPDTSTSETQTSSTVEPVTPDVPPPLNLNSFPESSTQCNLPDMSAASMVLQQNNALEDSSRAAGAVEPTSTPAASVDEEVFSEKRENGGRKQIDTSETPHDTRSVSQDMFTQTDQTDSVEQFKSNSASPKVAPKPDIQTRAFILENTDRSVFELVPNSCRPVNKREEKREDLPEPQNTYYVVEHNECVSPVVIHEYGEMLSFCKKQRSRSDADAAELNIQKTQQQKLEIQLRLQSLWSQGPQRSTDLSVQKSHESLLSDALSAHLANINAAASARLAETRATYLLETFRTSPTRDHLTSANAGSTMLGFYSRRPFSDSTL